MVPWVREALAAQPVAAWVPMAAMHCQQHLGNPAGGGWIKLTKLITPPGHFKKLLATAPSVLQRPTNTSQRDYKRRKKSGSSQYSHMFPIGAESTDSSPAGAHRC